MVKQNVDLNDDENKKVDRFSKSWKLSKTDVLKKMVRDFPEQPNDEAWMLGDVL